MTLTFATLLVIGGWLMIGAVLHLVFGISRLEAWLGINESYHLYLCGRWIIDTLSLPFYLFMMVVDFVEWLLEV